MEKGKRFAGLIESNKDSPFRILDVRSINQDAALKQKSTSEASDGESSGSEKELVIDMEDLDNEYDQREEVPNLAEELEIESKMITAEIPSSPPKPIPTGRVNRRKSQLVRLEDADVVFGAPIPTLKEEEIEQGIQANRYIMKHIAMLRTTINCLLDARYKGNIDFPHDMSDFATMDSWMDKYEQIKWGTKVPQGKNTTKRI